MTYKKSKIIYQIVLFLMAVIELRMLFLPTKTCPADISINMQHMLLTKLITLMFRVPLFVLW